MNKSFKTWHESLLNDFSELGICYQQDSIALNPVNISIKVIEELKIDLPKIANLARKVALKNFEENVGSIREDYVELIHLYKDKLRMSAIMRPDGIIVNNQLKLIELNIDSSIGGVWEVDFLQTKIRNNPFSQFLNTTIFPNPKNAFLEFLMDVKHKLDLPETPNLALVGYSDFNQFYKDQGQDICQWVNDHTSFNAFFVNPEMLRKEEKFITDGIRPYHIIYRDGALIHHRNKTLPMTKVIKDAYETNTKVFSDPLDLAVEHKGILALLSSMSEETNEFSNEEKALIEKYIPWTRYILDKEVIYEGNQVRLKNLLLAEQEKFVIKKCFSHAGEHVYIGAEINKEHWHDLVIHAIASNNNMWVTQENVCSDKNLFQYYIPDKGIVEKMQSFTFSPFVFGDHFGGALIRIEHNSNKRVLALPTNSEMGSAGVAIV